MDMRSSLIDGWVIKFMDQMCWVNFYRVVWRVFRFWWKLYCVIDFVMEGW